MVHFTDCWGVKSLHPWSAQKFAYKTEALHLHLSRFIFKVFADALLKTSAGNTAIGEKLMEQVIILMKLTTYVEKYM